MSQDAGRGLMDDWRVSNLEFPGESFSGKGAQAQKLVDPY
jgi:hypothetical protein